MKLSISNIAWEAQYDKEIYNIMKSNGFTGLEIAPTRIVESPAYEKCDKIEQFSEEIKENYGFIIPSMQSIWFGRSENMYESENSLNTLLEYTYEAIDFAKACKCNNLVFGSPKNRNKNEESIIKDEMVIDFFDKLGDYAVKNNTVIAIEPNPVIYNTNFINTTEQAISYAKLIHNKGIKVNMDLGTIIYNNEDLETVLANIEFINHIHISEPYLKLIEKRAIHRELYTILKEKKYSNYISIEMGKQEDINNIKVTIEYIASIFGE